MSRQTPDWIETYLNCVKESEPPVIYHKWVAISCLAAVMERRSWLEWDETTYPNMYIVIVGPSGCRKGTAMKFGREMLKDIGVKFSADSSTRRALVSSLNDSQDNFIYGQAQIPHCSMTVYSEELAVFLSFENRQLITDLCDWFDCRDPWIYKTEHAGINSLRNVWVNIIGATTPVLLQETMVNTAVGGGLTSRMIFVYAREKGKVIPYPFDTISANQELWDALRSDLGNIHLDSGPFKVTDGFLEWWGPWYTEQDKNPPFQDDRFAGYFNRRGKHLLKLCMIMSISRSDNRVIDVVDAEKAVVLLEETERFMPTAFSGVGKSDVGAAVNRVLSILATDKEVLYSELTKQLYHDVDPDMMKKVVATLLAMGDVGLKFVKKGDLIVDKLLFLK